MTSTTTPIVTLNGETVHVDPQLSLQQQTSDQLKTFHRFFTYELCSVPSSLFDTAGFIGEPQKPALADAIWGLGDCSCAEPFGDDIQFVLEGGSLLQRMPWSKGTTFSTVCNHYVNYVTGKYYDAVVVFYIYRSCPTTKDTAHLRHNKGIAGAKVYFTQNTPFKTEKEQVLSNSDNKQDFIFM